MGKWFITLLLSIAPILGHCDTEQSISGKVSAYCVMKEGVAAYVDFYAEGFAPRSMLVMKRALHSGAEEVLAEMVVTKDGWIKTLYHRMTLGIVGFKGEAQKIIFVAEDETRYVVNIVPFPLRFKDDKGHEAEVQLSGGYLNDWKIQYSGYEDGEEISTEAIYRVKRLHLGKEQLKKPFVQAKSPAMKTRNQGTCKIRIHSHLDNSDFCFGFDWGRDKCRRITADWVQKCYRQGRLEVGIIDSPLGYERTTDGLIKGYVET